MTVWSTKTGGRMSTRRIDDKEKWCNKVCNHPGHCFPTMLYIPPGEVWEHTCPACGQRTVIRGSGVTF